MAGFGLPNFGQLTEAFKKAQQIQQDAAKLQEELDAMDIQHRLIEHCAGGYVEGSGQSALDEPG